MRARRHPAPTVLVIAGLAAAPVGPLTAQAPQGAVEVGAARLQQRDTPATAAVTFGATLRQDAARHAVVGAAGVTLATEGGSTMQALFAASVLGRAGNRARWEIGGALTAFQQGAMPLTAGAYLFAREHVALGPFGGWAGVGLGGVEDLARWYPTRSADIGSWFARRGARLTAAATVVDTRSEPYDDGGRLLTDPVTYTDASLGARWAVRRLDVDTRAGLRLISRGALTSTGRGTRPFAAVDAAFWITPRVGIAAAVGRQLSDLARGTPDTRFAALALRVQMRARAPAMPARRPSTTDRPRLLVTRDSAAEARIIVTAPFGSRVELAASFTDWEAIPLVRRGESWELDRSIASGTHRVVIRIDGGPWLVPGNLPSASDDFGGTVGLLTVP